MNRVRELRKRKGLNQDELAALLNVQRAAVSKYETEKVPLTDGTIKRLIDIFDVTADYLLGRTDNPFLADEKELVIPDGLTEKQQAMVDIIRKLDGPELDKARIILGLLQSNE